MTNPLHRQDRIVARVFVLPALLGLLCFVLLPFVLAVILSLTNLRLGSPLPIEFVVFEQYRRIFSDTAFLNALKNNTLFALIVVPLQAGLALLLALLINQPLRGMVVFRTLFFMPVVFLRDEAGQLFSDLAITISAAVTASLIVAVTVLPTAASNLVKGSAIEDVHRHWWRWVTDHIMAWTDTPRRRRMSVAALTIIPFVLLMVLKPPADYLPEGKRNFIFGFMISTPTEPPSPRGMARAYPGASAAIPGRSV